MNTQTKPSIAQMRTRMTHGHRRWLEALRDGNLLAMHPGASVGEWRGLMTCRATLIGWGAIDGDTITDVGRQLLAAYLARATHDAVSR